MTTKNENSPVKSTRKRHSAPVRMRKLALELSCRRRGNDPHFFHFSCHMPADEAVIKYEALLSDISRVLIEHGFLKGNEGVPNPQLSDTKDSL